MGKRFWLCVLTVVVLVGHLVYDAVSLYQQALTDEGGHFDVSRRRLTQRVVLVVLDSWPERMLATDRMMPKLYARKAQGAAGVLWAPKQTATVPGILTLSTGVPPAGLAAVGLMSSSRYEGWTIFDDVVARGETVSFHGGPSWVPLFGDRSRNSFRETGHGPNFREDDVEALQHSRAAQLSAQPPALSVVHITETDVAGHLYGTEQPEYAEVLHFWDDQLDDYLKQVLRPGTTVIITADHGNDVLGSHGGPDPIFRRVPVVMLGDGIVRGAMIEMNAADMPVTIASLLDLEAPAAALSLPAVDALHLTPAERAQQSLTAYYHSVVRRRHVQAHPGLLAQAMAAVPPRLDDPQFRWIGNDQADHHLHRVKAGFADLEPRLGVSRAWQVTDWGFVVATFVLALALVWMARPVIPVWQASTARAWATGLAWWAGLEVLFGVRVAWLPAIRAWMQQPGVPLKAVALGLAGVGLGVLALGWFGRRRGWAAAQAHPEAVVGLAFVLATVSYPMTSMGMLSCGVAAALLLSRPWPAAWRWAGVGLSLGYAVAGPLIWARLGEDIWPRYLVGGPLALAGVAAIWAADRRWTLASAPRPHAWQALVLGLLWWMHPGAGVPVPVADVDGQRAWVSVLLVLAAATLTWWPRGTRSAVGARFWSGSWAPLLCVLAFWWWGSVWDPGLYVCLLGCALGTWWWVRQQPQDGAGSARGLAFTLGLAGALMILSKPAHAPTVLALVAVLWHGLAWIGRMPGGAAVQLVVAAITLVAARYGLFELFGFADSPAQGYSLKHLDLLAAYLGDDTRHIVGATAMVLLKIWLASAVLWAVAACQPAWRSRMDALTLMMAGLLAIEVGQAAIRAGLAIGAATFQYDFAAFTMLIHTGLLVFTLVAHLILRPRIGGWQLKQAV